MTTVIALAAIPLVLCGSRFAKPIVWVFNVFGTVDLLVAMTTETIYNAVTATPSVLDPCFLGPFCYW